MSTKYTYSISTDFPNGKLSEDLLTQQIVSSDIVTALDYISSSGDVCDIWFKAALSSGDQTILDGLVAAHSGEQPDDPATPVELNDVVKDDDKRIRCSVEPRKVGSALVIVTHNWCDPCTWYTQATQKTGQALSDSGDGLMFESSISNWIDLTHGRLYREDLVAASYPVKVYVDGVEKTPRTPFAESGGDYTVDYENGTITFAESQSGKTVTADFHHENGSLFIVGPTEGKRLWVEKSEVQFSNDVDLKDTIHFCPYAYNPADLPNKIPVASPTTYKKAQDFVDEANGTYPQVPAFGGTTRGLTVPHLVFPFNYLALKELKSSQGVEIRVWLESDVPFGGAFATATFYCTSYSEE